MEPFFGIDPGIANTIITAIASLLSALLGGLIAALATSKATRQALGHSLALEQTNRVATLRGVLLGIRTELEVLFEIYQLEMQEELESFKEGQAIYLTLPIYQHVFTVYESNCSLIGQIRDDELRESIIRTYLLAKSLINAHTYNNKLIEKYERITHESPGSLAVNKSFDEMKHYGAEIKATYDEASASLNDCLARIERYKFVE